MPCIPCSAVCPADVAITVEKQTQIPTDLPFKVPKPSWLVFKTKYAGLLVEGRQCASCHHSECDPFDVHSFLPWLLGEKEEKEMSRGGN